MADRYGTNAIRVARLHWGSDMKVERSNPIGGVAVFSAIALVAVLIVVGIGYPDWMWFPLFLIFWVGVVALIASVGVLSWRGVTARG
jgi:hypothetical protein